METLSRYYLISDQLLQYGLDPEFFDTMTAKYWYTNNNDNVMEYLSNLLLTKSHTETTKLVYFLLLYLKYARTDSLKLNQLNEQKKHKANLLKLEIKNDIKILLSD